MKVADIIKLVHNTTNVIIGHSRKGYDCDIGNESYRCVYTDMDSGCEGCEHLIECDSFREEFKGKCSDAQIKLADRTVLGLDIDITTSGRGKRAETTISLKIITRKPKED